MNNIIAISGNILNDNGSKKSFANDSYIQSVVRANGIPVIMPIIKDKDIIKKTLENVSGVIMTGGVDIHPFY
ncbi:gamma-glutamyl-gamma-aminobutyrate hydrolase family protein, partial [Brachyspira pilosicoli]|nr:gamma-glutamyl-gamma-aminobutyrate hydrolase family protein [Brachyspira pilosicoli]